MVKAMETGFGLWVLCALLFAIGCEQQQTPPQNIQKQTVTDAQPTPTPHREETAAVTTSSRLPLKLIVRIDGFANDKGVCRIAVYAGKAHFNNLEYAIAKESIAIADSKSQGVLEVEIAALKAESSIAVCAYHDENDNSRLEKNSFGIPIERYGFSTNPKRGFGPPKFSEVAIELDAAKLHDESGSQIDIPITIK